jgi:hypothetical protein
LDWQRDDGLGRKQRSGYLNTGGRYCAIWFADAYTHGYSDSYSYADGNCYNYAYSYTYFDTETFTDTESCTNA